MMMRIREALARFMSGRYGIDDLNKLLLWLYIILFIVNIFIKSSIIYFVSLIIFFLWMVRCFSKNIYKRQAENQKYIVLKNKITSFFRLQKNKWRDRKTHVYRKCKSCKAVLRLPKVKGTHTVECPKCHRDFKVKV